MSVLADQGVVHLTGACPVGDAEPLLAALQTAPKSIVDVSGATKLHLAVVQILLIGCPQIRGVPADPFLRDHVLPQLRRFGSEDAMPDAAASI